MTEPTPWPAASDVPLLIGRLESLVGREGIADDYARLRIALVRAQAAAMEALAERQSAVPPCPLREEAPLVHVAAMPVDRGVARPLFGRAVEACGARAETSAGLRRLERAVDEEPGLLDELVRFAPVPEEGPFAALARRLELAVEVPLLISRITAAPLVTDAAMRGANAGRDSFGRNTLQGVPERGAPPFFGSGGNCPVCGAAPGLAELRPGDGARVLHCSLCAYAWPFGRLDCPSCGGRNPNGIEKVSVEGVPARWLEVCRPCRRYLKTIDRRELAPDGPFLPLVEEVAGLYLDMLAERQDWLPNPPYAAVR